ncbi:hypothetical protein ACFQPA_11920 [Halomarina halobia]|uniref:Uncharacterized protein n=1 Tax=Halomarina halobia TaxID=3033386 RepID=A0ABD6AAK9_9EURY|nr:hypothetical protein [Halomarina sp. PSR21]
MSDETTPAIAPGGAPEAGESTATDHPNARRDVGAATPHGDRVEEKGDETAGRTGAEGGGPGE